MVETGASIPWPTAPIATTTYTRPQCPTRAKVRLQQQNSGITSSTIRQSNCTNHLRTTMTRCSHECARNEAEDPDVGPMELNLDF